MRLVCMALRTGYLLLEEVADDRTYATWKAVVEERLTALGAHVLYVVSDRAKALMQLAETGLECLIHAADDLACIRHSNPVSASCIRALARSLTTYRT